MPDAHNEKCLPKWAQERLESLRDSVNDLMHDATKLRAAHAILTDREWFTIVGPTTDDAKPFHLWFLERDDPRPVCSLSIGDLLLVGRARKDSLDA